jgi:hypothetical protein
MVIKSSTRLEADGLQQNLKYVPSLVVLQVHFLIHTATASTVQGAAGALRSTCHYPDLTMEAVQHHQDPHEDDYLRPFDDTEREFDLLKHTIVWCK